MYSLNIFLVTLSSTCDIQVCKFKHQSYCCSLIYMFMQKYTYMCWIHTDAMITDARNDKDRRTQISL